MPIFIGCAAPIRYSTILRDFISCCAQMPHQAADNRTRNLLSVAYRDGCTRVAERAFDWTAVIAVTARHFSALAATLFATSAAWTLNSVRGSGFHSAACRRARDRQALPPVRDTTAAASRPAPWPHRAPDELLGSPRVSCSGPYARSAWCARPPRSRRRGPPSQTAPSPTGDMPL